MNLEKLKQFPHVCNIIETKWGTTYLREYFETLLVSNRDKQRQGFSLDVTEFLMKLSEENETILNQQGKYPEEIQEFYFGCKKWNVPKNF